MTKRDHTTAPPVWQATIPAVSEAPTPTPPAETEPLPARLERLQHPDTDPTYLLYELLRSWKAGELIALDVPANGEVARIWLRVSPILLGAADDPFHTVEGGLCDIQFKGSTPYIAQSAIPSALRAERVAGMREAAGIADGLLMRSKYLTKSGGELPVYAEDVSIAIRAAADKMEQGNVS